MKKLILLIPVYFMFLSCNSDVEQTDKNITNKKLDARIVNDTQSSKPPINNPIMLEFFVKEKNLNKVDQVYREHITDAESFPYYDNLRQYGFQALIKHGLIENGNKEQKLFYITEQINSVANLPNISDFYLLLLSTEDTLSKDELISYGNRFYTKNLDLIENQIKYSLDAVKREKILQLKTVYKNFNRKVSLIKE